MACLRGARGAPAAPAAAAAGAAPARLSFGAAAEALAGVAGAGTQACAEASQSTGPCTPPRALSPPVSCHPKCLII
jgi:hypothetical protein